MSSELAEIICPGSTPSVVTYQDLLLLDKVITITLRDQPAYGHLMLLCGWKPMSLPDIEDEEGNKHPAFTAAVDKNRTFYINCNFLKQLLPQAQPELLIHELLHLVWGHPAEMEALPIHKRHKYNIAADLCINSWLPNLPYQKLSKEDQQALLQGKPLSEEAREDMKKNVYLWHPNSLGLPTGLTAMEYYDLLPDNKTFTSLFGGMTGTPGEGEQEGNQSPKHYWLLNKKEAEAMKGDFEAAICEEASKSRGTLPSGLSKILGEIERKTKLSWKQIFRPYIKRIISGDRKATFKRPDRRFRTFPGKEREKKVTAVVAVDTSGSTMPYREAFAAEVLAIYKETGCKFTVIECDAVVGKCYPFTGTLPTSMTGGGGTCFRPVFEYVKEEKIPCDLLVFLTDGYGENPPKPVHVRYPVIWLSTHANPASWGKIIKMF